MRSLEVFQDFGGASGAALNLTKSSVKFFGRWKDRTDVPGGLSHCEGPLRILGVDFVAAQGAVVNWTQKLGAVQKRLALWKTRRLTLIGKVLVLKANVLPSLLYLAYIYPLPASMRRSLTRLVFAFVWGGRYEYVARAQMLAPLGEGGRDVPHLPLRLDCFFVSFLLREVSSPAAHPSGHFLRYYFAYPARRLMAWSNLGPRSEHPPWHFAHAAKWLRDHPGALEGGLGLDQRRLYAAVRLEVSGPGVVGVSSATWLRVQLPGLDNGLKDFNWFCLHKRLPVRATMYRHGLARSPCCPRATCSEDETVRHALWGCHFAGSFWARARGLLARIDPGFGLSWGVLERGIAGRGRETFLLWLVISLAKRELWRARLDLVRSGKDGGVEGVYRAVVGLVERRVVMGVRRWGHHAARERWKGLFGLVRQA